MVGTELRREQLRASSAGFDREGETLTSIIGISGRASGIVALSFPRATGIEVTNRMLNCKLTEIGDEVTDALAELVNMIGGASKSKLDLDPPPELSLPSVVEGSNYRMRYPTKSCWIQIPFTCDAGPFVMEVTFSTD